MAESLLSSIAGSVLGKIASPTLQEAVAIYNFEDQINELRETLTAIKAVLLDAEERQAWNHHLRVWLNQLRDVLSDAEDVLDELECETLRKQVISRYEGTKGKVRRFFSFSNPLILRAKLSHKIKEILERLSTISAQKDQFNLNVRSADNDVAHKRSEEANLSYIREGEIVGRDVDKQKIIKMLLQEDDNSLSVIPIVGMGGLGKTSLTQLVYHDDSVQKQFELRIWVCVPDDFDLKKTIERIIEHAIGTSSREFGMKQLRTALQDIIKDKKYLLVLDDVWSIDRSTWGKLRDLLSKGASESKIIVTTRNLKIASIMGTYPAHNLKGLSHEDSMALFKQWAFDTMEKQSPPDLLEIGNDIVKKSLGVPLLVKALGSLLYMKYDDRHWTRIKDNEEWELVVKEHVLPVLKLSYDHLPSHLKRCFATFSLFPRGYVPSQDDLTSLWMALGLISSTREKLALEDGVEYATELWKRSLIEEVEESESGLKIKVHDLVLSLAMHVAQNDCFVVGLDTVEISKGVRYVSISNTCLEGISNFDEVPYFLRKPTSKKLRAIMFHFKVDNGVITREFARICISKCNHLRYLDLSHGSFEELPSSICNLKQLRLLDLRENKRLKKLPNSICELQSLLYLYLNGCSELRDLPKNMKRLVSLRYLYVTTKQESLQESGIQYLENLQFLGIDGCENLQVLFEGTGRLIYLRQLEIRNCGRQISLPFGELIALESLVIHDCKLMLTQRNKSNLPLNLRTLSISKSEQVMELLQCLNESACTLESFSVYDCPSFTTVPEWLPNHAHLKQICLIRCPNLSSMPQGIQSLAALKKLLIEYCGELSKRCQPKMGEDWPKIAHVPRIRLDLIDVQWTDD